VPTGPSISALISPRLSESRISFVPSGDFFIRSLTSLATRAIARGGRFSLDELLYEFDDDLLNDCVRDDIVLY